MKAQQLSELFTKHQEGNPYVDSMHLKDLLYVYKPTVKSKSQLADKNSLPKAHELLFSDCLHKLPDLRGIQERLDATPWEGLELPFKMTQRPSELRPITLKEFAVRFAQLRSA